MKLSIWNKANELTDGDEFGELALISKKPRAANIWTESETYLAVLSKNPFNRILRKTQVVFETIII